MTAISPREQSIIDGEWEHLRKCRDHLISQTDWVLLPDSPVSNEYLDAIKKYRQDLRDLPGTTDNPKQVIWPVKPE
jgi:hypothetical protein